MIHNQVEDQMSLITQMYPGVYAQVAQHQGNNKNNNNPVQPGNNKAAARRRRRKSSGKSGDQVGSGAGKRKLSVGQVSSLERSFEDEHKLESERKDRLAKELGLDPRQVAVWFQNRRARWKNKKLEEEHSSLKALYDNAVIEKSHLHSQVMRLTEQLNEADREIQRLAERVEIGSSNSPTSSLSAEAAAEPSFFGDFVAAQEYDDNDPTAGLYVGPDGDYLPNMEWMMGGVYM